MHYAVGFDCCNLLAFNIIAVIVFKLIYIRILSDLFPFSTMEHQKEMVLYDLYRIK